MSGLSGFGNSVSHLPTIVGAGGKTLNFSHGLDKKAESAKNLRDSLLRQPVDSYHFFKAKFISLGSTFNGGSKTKITQICSQVGDICFW
jgi:hypothetical protein